MRHAASRAVLALFFVIAASIESFAAVYEVGPGKPLATPSAVPWESLQPGDTVLIYWRTDPYRDKWVVTRTGTSVAPIVIRGVPGPGGELPVIDGSGAVTRLALDTWNESRFIIKIGGSSIPADVMPAYITIEGLDVRGAHTPNTFVDDAGATQSYVSNAAAIWIEKGEHITIRGNRIHDSGNGLFVSSADPNVSREILIDGNAIYDNGNVGSIYEHNTYTEALGITYQFNYFGAPKAGAGGNNLKDRSAGLVVRYNWIEGGNRQLDLVETDSATIQGSLSYRQTFVYGNVLIETDGAGNRQIAHYGGDNGTTSKYRKGTLYFYQNTMVSYRTDRTTLFRLSTNEERADVRNNIFYVTAAGSTLSLLDETGILSLTHNWFKPGRVSTFGTLAGTINDDGSSVVSSTPGFRDEPGQDFRLAVGSANQNAGAPLAAVVLPEPGVGYEYVKHQGSKLRSNDGVLDIGAFELEDGQPPPVSDLAITTSSLTGGTAGTFYSAALAASGGIAPYAWSLAGGSLPDGVSLSSTGAITGTPTQSGSFPFTAQVSDAQVPADVATRSLTLTVAAAPPPVPALNITTTGLPSARRNKNYSRAVSATGGVAPYAWRVSAGALPPGLSLNASTGVIAGKATTVGSYLFTVEVRDSRSPAVTDTQALTIQVNR